jgi:hypothetical protein
VGQGLRLPRLLRRKVEPGRSVNMVHLSKGTGAGRRACGEDQVGGAGAPEWRFWWRHFLTVCLGKLFDLSGLWAKMDTGHFKEIKWNNACRSPCSLADLVPLFFLSWRSRTSGCTQLSPARTNLFLFQPPDTHPRGTQGLSGRIRKHQSLSSKAWPIIIT